MLVVILPPELGLSVAVLREDGMRQDWCQVCVLHVERDYLVPTDYLSARSIVWRHEGRFLGEASLRHLVTGAPREQHGSHDGMTFSEPRSFFQ